MEYVIKNEKITATISSLGAELISVVGGDGFEYIWQNESGRFWGGHAPLLFPHCGRILNSEYTYDGVTYAMSAHGFARQNEFELVTHTENSIVMSLKANEEIKKNYPFDFELKAEYKVIENAIFANFSVQNNDKKVLPYMFGWHPAFALDCKNGDKIEDFAIKFEGVLECDWYQLQNGPFVSPVAKKHTLPGSEYKLNEKEIYENDTMIFVGTGNVATLCAPKSAHEVVLSYSDNLPYFCIWKYPSCEAEYICLEPWSAVPGDGIDPENFETKKMQRLASGECAVYSYTVNFKA